MRGKVIIILLLSVSEIAPNSSNDDEHSVSGNETTPNSSKDDEHSVSGNEIAPDSSKDDEHSVSHGKADVQHSGYAQGVRQQIDHTFSEPVITVIIFGAMAAIIGIILFIAYCVGKLRKKRVQLPPLHETDVPLSSIEIEDPVK